MYNHYYPVRRYQMGFTRSLGYAMGHVVAHTLVKKGAEQMRMIENRHRITDAEFVDVGPARRWERKHAQFGGDFTRSVNKPAQHVTIINKGTPAWKIILWMLLGAIGLWMFGPKWLYRDANINATYLYTDPIGTRMCKTVSNPPNAFDELLAVCPKGV